MYAAYSFYERSEISNADLIQHQGEIAKKPKVFRDDYDTYNTSMHLYLEGEKYPIVVPGKLLRKADQRILDLKEGDKLSFYEKREEKASVLEKTRRTAFGLSSGEVIFYSKEDSLSFSQHPRMKIWAGFFLILGLSILYWIIRAWKMDT